MVSSQHESANRIVSSDSYQKIVADLVSTIKISVDNEYESVFAKIDSGKIDRSGLSVEQISKAISENSESIKKYSIKKYNFLQGNADDQDYPNGKEPESEEKDVVLSVGNYAQGFLLTNVIEYLLAKDGQAKLLEYLKASKIPKAKTYAAQIMKFIA